MVGHLMQTTEVVAPALDDLATLRAVWDRSADGMALSDQNGIVLAVNPAYCRLYGFTPEQLVGRSFALIFPEEARADAELQYREIFQRGQDSSHESHVQSADHVELIVDARASFIQRDGQPVAMLSTIRDITAQRRAEAERDAFVASASHDLRQPLTLIKARSELILRQMADELTVTELKAHLLAIAASVDDLSEQLASLVDAVQIGAGVPVQIQPEPVEIMAWLREIVTTHQASTVAHVLRIDVPATPVVVAIDKLRMRRVLNNLLSNAIKYSPSGGEILVRACTELTTHRTERLVIQVADHGIGIPAADLPHIFKPHHRGANAVASAVGSGLGLAGVLAIIQQHRGNVEVDSKEGAGTTFHLSVPVSA
jgi:PAS domain S-box-containing protein